ncbi:ATP-binding protein [soil metagenome]
MRFLNTFRGRLLLILSLLLIATLGVQYYLNLVTQTENDDLRDSQAQALVSGIAIGFTSMTAKDDRVEDVINRPDRTFLDADARERIKDIIVINENWQVDDSLDPKYLPTSDESGKTVRKNLADLTDLPPLMEGSRLGDDLKHFPNQRTESNKYQSDEAHAIPIETSRGRWYVMVLLKNDRGAAARRAAQPVIYMLGILLGSSLITFLLVWRFTRPIANLSNAAREVAEGNLKVRVPDADRRDEMGRLAQNFNEMAAELEKKHELEAQLQQAEKSAVVGRLGSAIAHEIRNPLNYINLTLDHLRSKYAPEDEPKRATFEKLTSQLKAEVARINQQISDFLHYSRPTKADLKPIDARKVVEDSLRLVEPEAEEKGVKIAVVERENVPKIMGDPEFLRSVFNNLFINAMQSMESSGGRLNIKITPDDGGKFVNFEISDTGNGISKDNLTNIFEPYFSTKETGTGLGLAIVQKIVEIHNGTINVESNEGEGTKFTVKLSKAV